MQERGRGCRKLITLDQGLSGEERVLLDWTAEGGCPYMDRGGSATKKAAVIADRGLSDQASIPLKL
jgi:hypothetical protein